jgi:hypothetical protein
MERSILTSGKPTIMTSGRAITGGGTAITDEDGIIADAMTSITTGAMFVMTTGATIIRRRFDRISKIFAMRAMRSNRDARSCAGITRS